MQATVTRRQPPFQRVLLATLALTGFMALCFMCLLVLIGLPPAKIVGVAYFAQVHVAQFDNAARTGLGQTDECHTRTKGIAKRHAAMIQGKEIRNLVLSVERGMGSNTSLLAIIFDFEVRDNPEAVWKRSSFFVVTNAAPYGLRHICGPKG